MAPHEVRDLLLQIEGGTMSLVVRLLYGTGMRLLECLRLRVKDIEFERREIIVREGKGNKDRVTVLPENLIAPLQSQLARQEFARTRYCRRCRRGVFARRARRQISSVGPRMGLAVCLSIAGASARPARRSSAGAQAPHLSPASVQRAVRAAARAIGFAKPVTPHVLRHSFAPTCCRPATTSARCRNCWATRT